MRNIFVLLVLIHAAIHLMGTAKAFGWFKVNALSRPNSRAAGIVWFCAAAVLILAAVLYFFRMPMWWLPATVAIFVSQILIIAHWADARFGTVLNAVVLLVAVAGFGSWYFAKRSLDYVERFTSRVENLSEQNSTTMAEMGHLPVPVQKWLEYAGATDQAPSMVWMIQKGEMRMSPSSSWM